jgi:4-hydroxybenzoate polyprenyltransferase
MGLVILDAALATALGGILGLAILILLLPALYLGRWIYST